ncbi:hypothetical protein [Actinomadura coerulea]|uniref:hypothetical protein n=1 Tax=Actinomadura coerulea TaxID=46159 RepID=UPI00341EFB38
MSLTQGLMSPRTPLRRFLDRELSAGVRRVRATYQSRLPASPLILPREGVGYEAGAIGTAIDQRLRLAFTTDVPVDAATLLGVKGCAAAAADRRASRTACALAETGQNMVTELAANVAKMRLDDRRQPMLRPDDQEQHLARLLLAAAWYAVKWRNPFAFRDTPLCKAARAQPATFDLDALLAVPHRDLVDDLLAQLHRAGDGPLDGLRAATTPGRCRPGPTFEGSAHLAADADLIAEGLLLDFKSTRRIHDFRLPAILQLLGYVLLDLSDTYRIDSVGVYLTRAGGLVTWPLQEYLDLLGARRRDLPVLRAAFAQLLTYPGCRADDDPLPDELDGVERLLAEVASTIADGCCRVCAQPLTRPMVSPRRPRLYCSTFCSQRAHTLRRHGWLLKEASPEQSNDVPSPSPPTQAPPRPHADWRTLTHQRRRPRGGHQTATAAALPSRAPRR